jgi:hypothetical protein
VSEKDMPLLEEKLKKFMENNKWNQTKLILII